MGTRSQWSQIVVSGRVPEGDRVNLKSEGRIRCLFVCWGGGDIPCGGGKNFW